MPQFKPYDLGGTLEQANRIAGGVTNNQTALLTLADLKAKQASEQEYLLAIKNNPEIAKLLLGGGGSVLGSLGTAPGGPPGGGAITQGTFGPGGMGATQTVPAYPDASRFAGVSPQGGGPIPPNVMGQTMPTVTPPPGTPTLATLGPQGGMPGAPHGPMQGPQNPLLEMARKDPRAAMMLQQQMQTQQEQRWKTEERRLDMGVKIAEAVAQELNGVRDQASLDAARARVQQYHPQAAAQIPQFYSKEALEPLIMKGVAVKDLALWRKNMAQARQTDMMTEQLPATFKALEQFGTGGGAQAPTGEAAPTTGTQARTAPPEFESAITDANRLYPQVSTTRIKSIIAAESNFDPKAKSEAGAEGLMQLMPGTQKDMGVTNAYDPAQNVRGGTRYYAQMLTKYGGDERKALTAYNWGSGNLDKVNGDVSKAPPETQAYVNRVLGGGGAGPAGGTTGTAQAPPTDPRIAQLRARIEQGNKAARQAELSGMEGPARQVRAEVNDLQRELERLEDRSTEVSRAVDKETALQPLKLEQQRAAAEVSLEAKMNEPIGPENAINMNLPPQTRWKDVPKDVKITKQLGDTTAKQFSEFKASHAGLGRVLTMLDNPAAKSIIGTLFSGDNAAFRRRAGEWISSVTPQERKFVASLVAEIADIRHTLSGAAVSPTESEFLQPMMPSAADPDVGTVRAKLEALQEWMTRKHDAYRDQFEQSGYRVPAALARPEEKAQQGSGAVEKARNAMRPR